MTSFNLFDALIIVCGVVLAYNAVKMKTSGEIVSSMVLSKNVTPDQIKDKPGFIEYLWKKLLLCGIMCTVAGVVNLVISNYTSEYHFLVYVDIAINAVFFVILIIYGVFVTKAQKKFIQSGFPDEAKK